MTLLYELQPVITCGAIVLFGIYIYGYTERNQMRKEKPPCQTLLKVSQPHETKLRELGIHSLMETRDPWSHHLALAKHIQTHSPPLHTDGPQKHPTLDSQLYAMDGLFSGLS